MDIKEQIVEALKAAVKARQKERTSVLRMILAQIRNAEAASDKPDYVTAVGAYAKRLRKSLSEYERLGQTEKATDLKKEIAIVEEFLPRPLSEEEIEKIVEEVIAANNFTRKDFGRTMKAVMERCKGAAEGKAVSRIVKEKLPD